MNDMVFLTENSLISDDQIAESAHRLRSEIEQMNAATQRQYDDDRASINLVDDTEMVANVKALIAEKKKLHPKYVVVVGIGGSNLGTIAVQEAVFGKLYNQLNPEIRVLYADTVDSDLIADIVSIIEPVLKRGETVLINGVSKSGGTTETVANFEVLVDVVRKYEEDYQHYVVVTTDKNSKFWDLAMEKGFAMLEIPKKVGGRYSVFSAVGLFPLGLLGVNIDALMTGARTMRDRCLGFDINENPAALSAALIYQHSKEGRNIHDLFLFSSDLESIGRWYRQLMGESIGKEFNREQKQVFSGITPTVSIGSTDLHSMAQLYLGGPYDKFTTFVSVAQNKTDVQIPEYPGYDQLVEGIQKKPLKAVMDAIFHGVQAAFVKGKRPFVELVLPDKSAFSIGQFLQFKMIEMMYLGFLIGVNPFDQPNVESYKVETRKILESAPL